MLKMALSALSTVNLMINRYCLNLIFEKASCQIFCVGGSINNCKYCRYF